jgi:hypothetical protein
MLSIETTGLDEAISKLKKKSAALKNLEPAYKRCAAEFVKKTDDGFQNSKGYDGESWDALSDYTIEKRVGSLKTANKRGKNGKLTKGAKTFRQKLMAPGGIKPLIDTARARNSNHADTSKDGIDWSIVGYLGYSMGGTDKIPVRNPTPFYWDGSAWQLRESAKKSLGKHISAYVFMETL